MAFTGVLGTIFSGLGNFVLGSGPGSGNTLENDITIAGEASYTTSYTYATNESITIAGTSFIGPQDYFVTTTIAGVAHVGSYIPIVSDFTGIPGTFRSMPGNFVPAYVPVASGTVYEDSVTIAGTASYTTLGIVSKDNSITIAGTASISIANWLGAAGVIQLDAVDSISTSTLPVFTQSLSLSSTGTVTTSIQVDFKPTVTIAGVASYVSPGGVVRFNTIELISTAFATILPGTGYAVDLDLDATASYSQVEQYIKEEVLDLDATASVDTSSIAVFVNNVPIAGTASITVSPTIDYVVSQNYLVTSYYYPDSFFYEVLAPITVTASLTTSLQFAQAGIESPSATASVSVASQVVFNRTVSQTLALSQSAHDFHAINILSQTIVFAQTATVRKISVGSVTQTLTFTQQAYRVLPVAQALALVQTATVIRVHIQSVQQTFVMTQTGASASVLHRAATNTLVFNPDNVSQLPLFGQQDPDDLTNQFAYANQNVYVSLIKVVSSLQSFSSGNQQFFIGPVIPATRINNHCTVILGVPQRSIVLPCAQLGDTQGYTGSMSLKRSMTGDTFTYVKKSKTNKLKYLFWLGRQKGLELRDFLVSYNSQVMTLMNWKGETWYGFLVTNPFELVTSGRWQNAGERVDITMEFEGIKIGG